MSEWPMDRSIRKHHFRRRDLSSPTGNVSGQRHLRDCTNHRCLSELENSSLVSVKAALFCGPLFFNATNTVRLVGVSEEAHA